MNKKEIMKTLKVEKITLNVGTGSDANLLKKSIAMLKHITGLTPVKTITQARIQSWHLRPGLPIGCKLTLRGTSAEELLKKLLDAKDHILKEKQFDKNGNFSFGIHEYIDIPGIKYLPEAGVLGLEVAVTLTRPGFRIKHRLIKKSKVSKSHQITKDEAINFMKKNYDLKVEE